MHTRILDLFNAYGARAKAALTPKLRHVSTGWVVIIVLALAWTELISAALSGSTFSRLFATAVSGSEAYALQHSLLTKRPGKKPYQIIVGDREFVEQLQPSLAMKSNVWPLIVNYPTLPAIAQALAAVERLSDDVESVLLQNRPYYWTDHWSSASHSYGIRYEMQPWTYQQAGPSPSIFNLSATKVFFSTLTSMIKVKRDRQGPIYPETLASLHWQIPPPDKGGWPNINASPLLAKITWIADDRNLPKDFPMEIQEQFRAQMARNGVHYLIGRLTTLNEYLEVHEGSR